MSLERRRIAVAGLAYFAILCVVSAPFGTWADEEYTLGTTAHGVAYAWHRAISYELQAPLYFAIVALWRTIDPTPWFARFFSILCATGTFFALAKTARIVAPKRDPLPFALIVALNPYVVVAAFQIRLYALALLLATLLWLAYEGGFAGGRSLRARLAFVILAIAAIYVQYFLGFLLIGFAVGLLILRRVKEFVSYAGCCAVVALAVAPLALLATSQESGYDPSHSSHLSLAFVTLLHPWLEFFIPHLYTGQAETRLEHLAYLGLAVVGAFCAAVSRPNLTRKLVATIAPAITIEVLYVALTMAVGERLNDRYFVALFVPAMIAAYAFLRASTATPPAPQPTLVAIVAAMTLASLVSNYRFRAQSGDWVRVARYLDAKARPGDVIVIYTSDDLPAFERQYAGNVRTVPFPRPNPSDHYDVRTFDVASERVAERAFASLGAHRTLWLVDTVPCEPGHAEYGCDHVEAIVARDFTTISNRHFYLNDVRALTGDPVTPQSERETRPRSYRG